MADIRLIKLITGEDVLTEVRLGPNLVDFHNPVKIIVIPNKLDPRTPQIALVPWAQFTTDTKFKVDMRHILAIMAPMPQMIDQYNSIFSKIILPTKTLI